MNSLVHWTLLLWVPPLAATALWTAFVVSPLPMSAAHWQSLWIGVIGASLVSPFVAGGVWLANLKDWRRCVAVLVNLGGLAVGALGVALAMSYFAG
jgi:hypothetical protein